MTSRRVDYPGEGPRFCVKCGLMSRCKDTIDREQHVYRRYHCKCGYRWSTYEVLPDEQPE